MPITARRLQKRSASKIQNSFVLTPRRGAAMLADLEKARAARKDRLSRSAKKCRAPNLANLQKTNAVCGSRTDKASRSKPETPLDSKLLSLRLHDLSRIGTPEQEAPCREAGEGVAQSPGAHAKSAVAEAESPQQEHGSAAFMAEFVTPGRCSLGSSQTVA
jgi:hypothetical protein